MSSKTIRTGFVGCGVVGTGVGDLAFSCGDDPKALRLNAGKLSELTISIENMFQNVDRENHRTATAVMLTPQAQERTVREALEQADALPHTLASTRLLRILG